MVNSEQNNGKVFAISISEVRGTKKHNVEMAEFIADYGIKGDAHAGKWHRQISLLSIDSIRKFNYLTGYFIKPGDFAENITVEGLDLLLLPIGSKIKIGDKVILEITQHGKQCHNACEIFKNVGKCAMPTEGIFAKVLNGGMVKKGDGVQISFLGDQHIHESPTLQHFDSRY